MEYDICILGAGPGGLSSAIYASRYGLKTLVISKDIGGTAKTADRIENYPGFEGSGEELMEKFHKQAEKFGAEFLDDDIIEVRKEKEFIVTATTKKITARSVIIALGLQRRKLNIPGEDKLLGKGVSYCAVCDGRFFKRKDVAVIGGGDSACKAALLLSDIARKVYFVYRGEKEECESIASKKLRENKNIEFIFNATPFEIRGKDAVKELIIVMPGRIPRQEKIEVDGVFIEIGGMPVSDIVKMLGVKIDREGHILVDENMKTNVRGVFAAGDIVKSKLKQIVVAASQGALAAKSAYDYLRGE
ncbi:MAG: FAD-dependent oxidoreductase [Nanoarchaeota archaeon]